MQRDQVADGLKHVLVAEQSVLVRSIRAQPDRLAAELLVQLVASHPGQVVALGVVEQRVDEPPRRLDRGQLTGTQLAVEVEQRLVPIGRGVLLERVGDQLGTIEQLE